MANCKEQRHQSGDILAGAREGVPCDYDRLDDDLPNASMP